MVMRAIKQIVYTVKRKIFSKEFVTNYSDELKVELDRRYADYKSGKAEIITAEESKRRIEQISMKVKGNAY